MLHWFCVWIWVAKPTNQPSEQQQKQNKTKPQTTKKSPKTEYFTQANKLFGIPEDDKNKTKKATKKPPPPQYQEQYYYWNMCNRILKKSHRYDPVFSLHQAKESPKHYGQDNIFYLTSSLPTETQWGSFQLHWLSFFRPSSIQKSQERFSDRIFHKRLELFLCLRKVVSLPALFFTSPHMQLPQ